MHDSSPVKSTSTVVGPPDTESNQGAAHFQIPSSDMSEAGYSESSLQSERFLNGGQILTKTEALTAKQQVSTKFYFLLQCWLRSDWKFAGSKFLQS